MIKVIFLDVDGTLTDGKIIINSDGTETKHFSVKDGIGIKNAINEGIRIIIVTGRKSECVSIRCKELGINDVYQGIENKSKLIQQILCDNSIQKEESAFMGDDINDLEAMNQCGLAGTPSDGIKEVKIRSHFISSNSGGNGAVREFLDHIVNLNKESANNTVTH